MRWVNIYEEYRRVLYDYVAVKHLYRKVGSMRVYICQFSLKSELDQLGPDFARKFYLVKSYSTNESKPKRFDLKNGDVVKCFYCRDSKHQGFTLEKIVVRRTQDIVYPHPCYREKPVQRPLLTLYE